MVSQHHRARSMPDCRHVVADRNGRDDDQPDSGATPTKPGSCTRPLPGIKVEVVTREGKPVPAGSGGYLVIRKPWPSMLRTIYGDPERYQEQYWSQIPGAYFTGDGARQDEDGYIWVMGRVDDVINVSGHRLSTMEVESALVAHRAGRGGGGGRAAG